MNKLVNVANTIWGNEHCMGLYEIHEQAPDSSGFRRYQIIHVIRDGRIAEFRTDMGKANLWKGVKQLRIPSFMEHTVDELKGLAIELRNETEIDVKDWLEIDTMKLA